MAQIPSLHKQSAVTMSSREIAELTGKQHAHVIRDIRAMLDALKDDPVLDHVSEEKDGRGYTACFHLDRELTETLLTGYSIPLRRRVIARLHELERQHAPRLPQNFAEALRLAADQADQAEQIEQQQQALAIAAPKVEFVDRYIDGTGLKGFRQVCKLLKANEARFREFLENKRIMYRVGGEWVPYAPHIDAGRFAMKTGIADNDHAYNAAKFTPKGVQWVAELWAEHQKQGDAVQGAV